MLLIFMGFKREVFNYKLHVKLLQLNPLGGTPNDVFVSVNKNKYILTAHIEFRFIPIFFPRAGIKPKKQKE